MIRDISKLMFFMCMCTVEGASELLDDFDDVWHVGKHKTMPKVKKTA